MTKENNAFDLLRILLAVGVLISHGIIIGGYPLRDPLNILSKGQSDLGEFCVMGFFTLSGFLIAASFERSNNVLKFLGHRLLRIVPGFWVSLLFTGFVIGPIMFWATGRAVSDFSFKGANSAASFFYRNMFFTMRQWTVKGVLDHSAYNQSLNGSLWSLYPELQCYAFTMIAGAFGLFKKNRTLLLIVGICVFVFFAINVNFSKTFGPTILILGDSLKLYAAYMGGTLIYVYREQLFFDKRGTIFLIFFTLMLIKFGGYNLLSPLLVALVLINVFRFFQFRIKYDISYGIYIYAFPLQQLIYLLFGSRISYLSFTALSILSSSAIGLLSYLLIERPFINLRPRIDRLFKNDSVKINHDHP